MSIAQYAYIVPPLELFLQRFELFWSIARVDSADDGLATILSKQLVVTNGRDSSSGGHESYFQPASLMRLAYIFPMSPIPMIPTVVPSILQDAADQVRSFTSMRAPKLLCRLPPSSAAERPGHVIKGVSEKSPARWMIGDAIVK